MFAIDRDRILAYLKLSLFQTILFVTVYGVTNWIAMKHHYHYKLWHPLELQIPFVPAMILGYFSLNILMIIPAFTLEIRELKGLNSAMMWATIMAGFVFLVFPAPIGFARTAVAGEWSGLYQNLYSVDNVANTFPSLHITFSYLFSRVIVYTHQKLFYPFWSWFVIISLSVLLTHQHHLIDIFGGIVLAEICFKYFFLTAIND